VRLLSAGVREIDTQQFAREGCVLLTAMPITWCPASVNMLEARGRCPSEAPVNEDGAIAHSG